MEEQNRNKLAEALKKLPEHEPDALLWNQIEASLDFEEHLKSVLPDLTLHEPDNFVWAKIEQQLDQTKEPKHFNLSNYFRYFSAAAASIILLLVSVYIFRNQSQEKVKIAYSEEIVSEEKSAIEENPENSEGLQFIQEQCSQLPEICQKPEFKELKGQLEQLETENEKIKRQIELFGEDPVLIRNQIKIENLRATYTKELIQIIIS